LPVEVLLWLLEELLRELVVSNQWLLRSAELLEGANDFDWQQPPIVSRFDQGLDEVINCEATLDDHMRVDLVVDATPLLHAQE
jgi:hypothetical protein